MDAQKNSWLSYAAENSWVVVSFKEPCLMNVSDTEVWMLNPEVRYVFNYYHVRHLENLVEQISALRGSAFYRPLNCASNLAERKILAARSKDRGIGDLLFMTGPMAYMHHVTAGTVGVDMYALSDRGLVLLNNPFLRHQTTLSGPLIYDTFQNYDYHWLVDVATEFDAEKDQLNVYDCLYQQLGVDYRQVDPKFKRPTARLRQEDQLNFDALCFYVYRERGFDLRKTSYYVVAPLAHGTVRTAPYKSWLDLIDRLQTRRPVVVVGALVERMPSAGMTAGEFVFEVEKLSKAKKHVVNLISEASPLRVMMAVVANARLAVCLDSGLLYVAQAFRVPAVSIWGPIHPGVRLGYDPDYMELAVWRQELCAYAPCFAYGGFPVRKCPRGEGQQVCEVLSSETLVADVIDKVGLVEGRLPHAKKYAPGAGTIEGKA